MVSGFFRLAGAHQPCSVGSTNTCETFTWSGCVTQYKMLLPMSSPVRKVICFASSSSAVLVGMLSVGVIKTLEIKTTHGEKITFTKKTFNKGHVYGGLLFGLGWSLTGACPGPLFAQIGTGATVMIVPLLSAVVGTCVYGRFRTELPH